MRSAAVSRPVQCVVLQTAWQLPTQLGEQHFSCSQSQWKKCFHSRWWHRYEITVTSSLISHHLWSFQLHNVGERMKRECLETRVTNVNSDWNNKKCRRLERTICKISIIILNSLNYFANHSESNKSLKEKWKFSHIHVFPNHFSFMEHRRFWRFSIAN